MARDQSDIGAIDNLSQLGEEAVLAAAQEIRCAIPGIVTRANMNATPPTVNVQPAVKRAEADGADPIIPDVPLLFPRSKKASFTFPVEAGDDVLLIICDRDTDLWEQQGGGKPTTPSDPRTHDLSDALAIPISIKQILASRIGDLSIMFGGNEVRMGDDGTITVEGLSVKLGKNATDAAIKGTTFNLANNAMLGLVATAFTSIGNAVAPAKVACDAAAAGITATFVPATPTWTATKAKAE